MTTANPEHPAPPVERTRGALKHLGLVTLTCAVLAAATYVTPGLGQFRPWIPGEKPPLSQLFRKWGTTEVPTFAGAGSGYQAPRRGTEQLEQDLGEAVAGNLGEPRQPGPDARGPGEAAEGRPPAVRIEPQEYAGIDVGIHDPGHRGLAPFFKTLLRTAERRRGALTRIAHYGDSSIATDLITYTIRRRMQKRFGDGGHGFVLTARGHMPWGHRDVVHRSNDAWRLREVVRRSLGSGRYGYGGVQYRGRPGARAKFATDEDAPVGRRVSRYELFYLESQRGGRVRLEVDGEHVRDLDTRAESANEAYEQITVPDGPHELEVQVRAGQPILYGVVMERDGPGVVYDSLGLVGARARRLLNFDQDHIAEQLRHRSTDLLVLGFGGNEADDPPHRLGDYDDEFARVIRHMRAGREDLACLVFAPLDQARRNKRGRVQTMETVPLIVKAQKRAARREGCAFYNTFQAMGGKGAMQRWHRARPRLALSDFRHATPAGYEVIGNMFYKALLESFADWLEDRR